MPYFSRLTDIVTCNLSELLAQSHDPLSALQQIIREMEEGLAGAKRSVASATASEERLTREVSEQRQQMANWSDQAKVALREGRESEARQSLLRKREVEDLVAGLSQQHQAAVATRDHLATMQRALEARLADALRRRAILQCDVAEATPPSTPPSSTPDDRLAQVEEELAALKRELQS